MAINKGNHIILSFSCLILLMGTSYSQTERKEVLQGQPLKDGDELVSAFGNFKLGFFSPDDTINRYLGIWYNKPNSNFNGDKMTQPVWVANRNTPILDRSGSLTIDSTDGNLKILHNGGDPIVISSIQAVGKTSATLEKSGNIVLYEINLDGSKRELWQSFDYPTDTLLPGMKLGINLQTGHQWFLQSWISSNSPSQGSFTLSMDPNVSNKLIIRWLEEAWTIGLWLNGQFDDSSRLTTGNYKFSYTSNEKEKYFSYSIDESYTSFPIIKISASGSLTNDSGLAMSSCDYLTYGKVCWNGKIPFCRSDYNYYNNFQAKHGLMSGGDGLKFKESDNITLTDCAAKCFSNCSCVAFAPTNAENHTGCEIWSRGTKFIQSDEDGYRRIYTEIEPNGWWLWLISSVAGALLVIILLSSLSYRARRKQMAKDEKWWMSLIIVVGVALLIPLLCYLCFLLLKKFKVKVEQIMNRRKLLLELGVNLSSLPTTYSTGRKQEKDQSMKRELKIFDFQTIAVATNNFSTVNKLGEGGFGPVYKGKLLDGQEIAIKRLSRSSGQGIVEFKNEAKLVAKLQHTNLVRLLGCALHGEERILVYEYMPNGSLDSFIFGSADRSNLLNWKIRFHIIEGIAQGLIYLHKYSRLTVIHRDLKASNVLLDDRLNPKISDFGMAKIFGANETEANTNRVVGTYGYMSPEYAMSGIVSMKIDVFSFGVLVLEIISGKKNYSTYDIDRPLNLVGYAWELWNEGKGLELIDPTLHESCSPNELLRCIHAALLCVQDQANDRPTMSDVISMLTNETMPLPAPKQPAFFINSCSGLPEVSQYNSKGCSINDVTISELAAR